MPMGEVAEYANLANTMEAQERMNSLMDMAAATSNLLKGAQRQHIRDLRKQARGPHFAKHESVAVPQTMEETIEQFSAVGIEVVLEGSEDQQAGKHSNISDRVSEDRQRQPARPCTPSEVK